MNRITITRTARTLQYSYGLRGDEVVPSGPMCSPTRIRSQARSARRQMCSLPGFTNAGVQWWEQLFVDGVAVDVDHSVPECMDFALYFGEWTVTASTA